MADKIIVEKIVNGYVVRSDYYNIKENHIIHFKDMKSLVKHLDDCFVKPYDKIKIEDVTV